MRIALLLIFLLNGVTIRTLAQTGNQIWTDELVKVLAAFPDHFSIIRGQVVEEEADMKVYETAVQIKGTLRSSIKQYGAAEEGLFSWENILYDFEDFDTAAKQFKKLHDDIKRQQILINGNRTHFTGTYLQPSEWIRSTTIQYELPNLPGYEEVVLDATMQYLPGKWQISITIYKRIPALVD
jgi:hypothetical protein